MNRSTFRQGLGERLLLAVLLVLGILVVIVHILRR
jgi:hypothetical protein